MALAPQMPSTVVNMTADPIDEDDEKTVCEEQLLTEEAKPKIPVWQVTKLDR